MELSLQEKDAKLADMQAKLAEMERAQWECMVCYRKLDINDCYSYGRACNHVTCGRCIREPGSGLANRCGACRPNRASRAEKLFFT